MLLALLPALAAAVALALIGAPPLLAALLGLGLWLLLSARREPVAAPPSPYRLRRSALERPTGITVTCRLVTARRQEWVSDDTGRIYDVLVANGVERARAGDRGVVMLRENTVVIRAFEEHPERRGR